MPRKNQLQPQPPDTDARARLLYAALNLFARHGFTKASVRDIAQKAQVNIAAISYYFGDKAGLYRAAFTEPLGSAREDIALYDQPDFTLRQSLAGLFDSLLAPMQQGDIMQQCMRLHFREMLEPTGVWTDEIDRDIKPAHTAVTSVLKRHLQLTRADDDLHRLAFSIVGLALQLFMTRDVIDLIRPRLLSGAAAIDVWRDRLVDYAEAMVGVEAKRRKQCKAN